MNWIGMICCRLLKWCRLKCCCPRQKCSCWCCWCCCCCCCCWGRPTSSLILIGRLAFNFLPLKFKPPRLAPWRALTPNTTRCNVAMFQSFQQPACCLAALLPVGQMWPHHDTMTRKWHKRDKRLPRKKQKKNKSNFSEMWQRLASSGALNWIKLNWSKMNLINSFSGDWWNERLSPAPVPCGPIQCNQDAPPPFFGILLRFFK